jgi:putative ABC transport system ATP-binding protein
MSGLIQRNDPVVAAVGLSKIYQRGREQVRALDNATFDVWSGEFVVITGPSGSGKSTLLNLVGCMDAPSFGSLKLLGKPVENLAEQERTLIRREKIGFVFQHFGLLPTLTVAENVALPALFARRRVDRRVNELLEKVGLGPRRDHRPHELSGGEMQRAAIARALINEPQLLLADEPTGNLDTATGETVLNLFLQLNVEGLTLVVVTHNPTVAGAAQRRILLQDGRCEGVHAGGRPFAEFSSPAERSSHKDTDAAETPGRANTTPHERGIHAFQHP